MAINRGSSLPGSVLSAVFILIAVAIGARVAYELLAPLLPSLIALAIVGSLLLALLRRR
jgi:hypothetical protein